MFPMSLDLALMPTMLVGGGPASLKRLQLLDAAGARGLKVLAPEPEIAFAEAAGDRLERRLPTAADFDQVRVLFVADLPLDVARPLAEMARSVRVLVNVEDVLDLCDFHVPAMVRRGELLIAISTGGRSPGLARLLKAHLGERFGPEWEDHLEELAAARLAWRAEGKGPGDVSRLTTELIRQRNWLG